MTRPSVFLFATNVPHLRHMREPLSFAKEFGSPCETPRRAYKGCKCCAQSPFRDMFVAPTRFQSRWPREGRQSRPHQTGVHNLHLSAGELPEQNGAYLHAYFPSHNHIVLIGNFAGAIAPAFRHNHANHWLERGDSKLVRLRVLAGFGSFQIKRCPRPLDTSL
jgi:hypothetical protein